MTCDLVCSPVSTKYSANTLQERPCTRCVKRDIGHLCHDEPREAVRRSKGERSHTTGDDDTPPKQEELLPDRIVSPLDQPQAGQKHLQENGLDMVAPGIPVDRKSNVQLAQTAPMTDTRMRNVGVGNQNCRSRWTAFVVKSC